MMTPSSTVGPAGALAHLYKVNPSVSAEIFCNSIGLLLELLHLGVQHQLLHVNQMMVKI